MDSEKELFKNDIPSITIQTNFPISCLYFLQNIQKKINYEKRKEIEKLMKEEIQEDNNNAEN